MTHDTVFLNKVPIRSGQVMCEGDVFSTSADGAGSLIPKGATESDGIAVAGNTDPRVRWSQAGCLIIDNFSRGKIVVNAGKVCKLVRMPDALLLQAAGRTQYAIGANRTTELAHVLGPAPVKLQAISDIQVRQLPLVALQGRTAPPALQPKAGSLTVYRAEVLAQPPRALSTEEIRVIDNLRLRSTITPPTIRRP